MGRDRDEGFESLNKKIHQTYWRARWRIGVSKIDSNADNLRQL